MYYSKNSAISSVIDKGYFKYYQEVYSKVMISLFVLINSKYSIIGRQHKKVIDTHQDQ